MANNLAFALRSYYSLKDGFLSPEDAVAAAAASGADVIAFADRGELAGYYEFMAAIKNRDLMALPGVELALNYNGLIKNSLFFCGSDLPEHTLWDLVASATPSENGLPVVDQNNIPKGLMVFSGSSGSHVEEMLWAHDLAGIRDFLISFRKRHLRVGLSIDPKNLDAHTAALVTSLSSLGRIIPSNFIVYPEGLLNDYQSMRDMVFSSLPDYQAGVIKCASPEGLYASSFRLEDPSVIANFGRKPEKTIGFSKGYRSLSMEASNDLFKSRAEQALALFIEKVARTERGSVVIDKVNVYQSRLKEECQAITLSGASPTMLMAADCADTLRHAGIECKVRGSAVHSLCCFVLGLSNVNPVYEHLGFERFINPYRSGLPDIDFDIAASRVGEARSIILNNVPGTVALRQFSRATFLSGLRKVLSIADPKRPDDVSNDLVRALRIEHSDLEGKTLSELRSLYSNFDEVFISLRPREEIKMEGALSLLTAFDGRPRSSSFHVGIAQLQQLSPAIMPLAPLMDANGSPCLAAALPYSEALKLGGGIAKIDFLAAHEMDFKHHINEILIERGQLPLEDGVPSILPEHLDATIGAGHVAAIPQFSRQASLCAAVRPQSYEEICALNALVRLSSHRDIVENFLGNTPSPLSKIPSSITSKLAPLLESTRGVILYDEQLTAALHLVTGIDKNICDTVRSSIKNGDEVSQKMRSSLLAGIKKCHHVNEAVSTQCLDFLLSGGTYLFNRGHACAYGANVASFAKAKCDHPAEFMTAFVRHYRSGSAPCDRKEFRNTIARLASEARSMGVHVFSPDPLLPVSTRPEGDVRHGRDPLRTSTNAIRIGLDALAIFTHDDLMAVAAGESPRSDAAISFLKRLRQGGEAAREAFTQECGFLPDDLHPGIPVKTKTPATLLTHPLHALHKPVAACCFVHYVSKPKLSSHGIVVTVGVSSLLGEEPIYAKKFFPANGNTNAESFVTALQQAPSSKPLILHLKSSARRDRPGYFWNIESVRPITPKTEDLTSCIDLVERAGIARNNRMENSI